MPNVIKYLGGVTPTGCLRKGNMLIGNNTADYGGTFYNGINPPNGGYTIYLNKASGGPSIYCPANNTQLIGITNQIAGANYTTSQQCFDYYNSQIDKVCVTQNYPTDFPFIVLDGLVFYVDAGVTISYPGTGTTWTDVNGLGTINNGTLINGPTYNSANSGSIVFDGVDDYVACGNLGTFNDMSFQMFVKVLSNSGGYKGFGGAVGASGQDYESGFNIDMQSSPTDSFTNCSIEGGFLRVSGGTDFMTSSVSFGTWCNICFTISPTFIQFYLNGVAQYGTNRLNNASSTIGMNNLVIGARPYSLPNTSINANIANTQIYNRSLTSTEVLQNYNALKGRFGL
jgi:hypothetical protein